MAKKVKSQKGRFVIGLNRPRPLWIVPVTLLCFAVLATAVVIGWGAANSLAVAKADRNITEPTLIALPDYSVSSRVQMPDVRGLSENAARQVLVDSGLPASLVSVNQKPSAGTPGVVIQQTPVFGVVNPDLVTITISAEAKMPEIVGMTATEAITMLRQFGARVEQVKQYVPGAEVGTVTASVPEAGSAIPDSVQIRISDTAVTALLDDFESLQGGGNSTADYMHIGKRYDSSLLLSSEYGGDTGTSSWRLSGSATTLQGTLSVEESKDGNLGAEVVVVGDGNEIARIKLVEGELIPFEWNMQNIDTLSIAVTSTSDESVSVLMLDSKVLGTFDTLSVEP